MSDFKREYLGNYIQGHFIKVTEPNGEIESKDPGNLDKDPVEIPFRYAVVEDVVGAAKRAFVSWRKIPPSDRYEAITRYKDILEKRTESLARCVSEENGKSIWESQEEIRETVRLIDYYLESGSYTNIETKIETPEPGTEGRIRNLPNGAVAVIGAPDLPILTTHQQIIPALINGNTIVFKPSVYTPISGQMLAEIAHDSGLSGGVFNLIHGDDELSRRLSGHRLIDCVFFCGSYETGAKLKKEVLPQYWKTVVLELGGRNCTVVWEDAAYEKALYESLVAAFMTTGQRMNSTGSLLLHEKIADQFIEDFHRLAKKLSIGYSQSADTPFMGPMFSERTMENYLAYQGIALREGCEEIMRGKALERSHRGHYVTPSIHLVAKPDRQSVYQKDQIFGPNVAIYRIKDLDEASEIIDLTRYGFVAALYSKDRDVFNRFFQDVNVSLLYWNKPTTSAAYRIAHGGIRKSGNSRPMGSLAHFQCTHPISSLESTSETLQLPPQLPRL